MISKDMISLNEINLSQVIAVQNIYVLRKFIRNQAGKLEKIRFGKTTRPPVELLLT